jgi:uncharacterized cupredoxin-like copper-binding protein
MSSVRSKSTVSLALGVGVVALLSACGSSGTSASSTPTSAVSSVPAATGSSAVVTATETEFKIALSKTNLSPGTYTFTAQNKGQITHALTVDGPGVSNQSTGSISPGSSKSVTVKLVAGSYDVYCPVANHKMEGMDIHVTVA